jgi:hypothetical protein
MCRKNLVEHIGAFADLHGKIGDLGVGLPSIWTWDSTDRRQPDEQVKVIQAITSVIQALDPHQAIDPVYVCDRPLPGSATADK